MGLAPDPPLNPWKVALGCTFFLLLPTLLVCILLGIVVGVPHHEPASPDGARFWSATKYALAVLFTGLFIADIRKGGLRDSLRTFRLVRPKIVVQNRGVVLLTIGCGVGLVRAFPFLDRSWLYLVPGSGGHPANIGLLPATIKYYGLVFLLLLALNVPRLARAEELKYRRGTRDWRDAIVRSVRFGLAHYLAGVPLYAGLALSIGGLWFTHQYFRGGVERSTLHHVTYNLVMLVVLFVLLLLQLS